MQRIIFYIIYPLIWLLSKAPFPVLYFISDIGFFITYHIIGYRKDLVLNNLKMSFPEKSEKELLVIRKKFYHHFIDVFAEMLKTFTISNKQMKKRFKIHNMSLIEEIAAKNKSIIIVGSHYANWEWILSMNLHTKIAGYGTYTKINNIFLENKIKTTRERFGGVMVLQQDTIRNMARNYRENKVGIYGLLSDQSPQLGRTFYWSDFMGVRVPIHTGAETLAKRYDCAVVFMKISKLKRGYYEVRYETLTETPKDFPDYEITDMFLKKTEAQIRENPNYYLWTHNRFKHKGKE